MADHEVPAVGSTDAFKHKDDTHSSIRQRRRQQSRPSLLSTAGEATRSPFETFVTTPIATEQVAAPTDSSFAGSSDRGPTANAVLMDIIDISTNSNHDTRKISSKTSNMDMSDDVLRSSQSLLFPNLDITHNVSTSLLDSVRKGSSGHGDIQRLKRRGSMFDSPTATAPYPLHLGPAPPLSHNSVEKPTSRQDTPLTGTHIQGQPPNLTLKQTPSDTPYITPSQTQPIVNESGLPIKGLWDYIKSELTSSDFDESQDFKTERIRNFINVPRELEKFMYFGYIICLDSFLYIFTILPLRVFIAMWCAVIWILGGASLKPAQKTDLIKGALVSICTYILQYFDASRLYHSVRGQALIKLYVIFNVLEICDKLCSAFGHDILDSLFSLSHSRQRSRAATRRINRFTHFIIAVMYIFAHSLILFYQVMTLNVAVNSFDNALMTLLLSNQFVEIKGSVFKRFERENLFQLSCSDIVERFQLSIFLIIIGIRNFIELVGGAAILSYPAYIYKIYDSLSPYSWCMDIVSFFRSEKFLVEPEKIGGVLWLLGVNMIQLIETTMKSKEFKLAEKVLAPIIIVYITEILVDWLKHAFITKFNGISPSVYERYRDSLCRDLLGETKKAPAVTDDETMKMASVDRSPIVARRIGFVSIPLSCLVIRVTIQTLQMITIHRTPQDKFKPDVFADRSGDDGIVGWQIPFTFPTWLNSDGLTVLFGSSSIINSLLWIIPIYLLLIVFKLILGLQLLHMAKTSLERPQSDTAGHRPSVSVAPGEPLDVPSKAEVSSLPLKKLSLADRSSLLETGNRISADADAITSRTSPDHLHIMIPKTSLVKPSHLDTSSTPQPLKPISILNYKETMTSIATPSSIPCSSESAEIPSQPLAMDSVNQSVASSVRSSVDQGVLSSEESDEKSSVSVLPLSPGINEEKLDKIDRFTMVKSRIV
ncbi:hypothetical protein BASA50_007612 [Batrachochytrium salamandrivorans]|uniref:DUF747-domain-containing protein n=1 Tax=Batrachochytrium salamandrivorans TaxID=1357716 RepID=A0ABQ8F6I2_9FUNG|nr:hypothetical protein BASA62_000427 [Batrachochytrium salamandrivorans]KAH6582439.1 hypothetical protein BASA61_008548 [Batrachochytrium salamandrivorans]KAH6593091.1 hypothetical protein BASA50_007612 [Batrachochytrium salamandrivorans]KAH9254720.1 hypothetical protein BASA81_007271 [Batrachochytrium salamandrivorans]KAH9266481.1 hypothetical protein BASA84_001118 [Batrachochytrium salamandrivorans]